MSVTRIPVSIRESLDKAVARIKQCIRDAGRSKRIKNQREMDKEPTETLILKTSKQPGAEDTPAPKYRPTIYHDMKKHRPEEKCWCNSTIDEINARRAAFRSNYTAIAKLHGQTKEEIEDHLNWAEAYLEKYMLPPQMP